ncbi:MULTISPECIES: Na+/H+ antiporter NhaC [Aminobacterium]|jgi:NhaC family Na+:H+ antiporter|uniref:Na+/H+ antiporter NhaC n=1 Tax=Aminobacterium TaxID=81466 RepID=UPI00046703A2|nr:MULTISPECIES: Na+/H+ antiporter NhaC [Aminobacterium]
MTQKSKEVKEKQLAPLGLSLGTFALCAFVIGFSIMKLGVDAHIPMVIAATICAAVAMFFLGKTWQDVENGIVNGIQLALIPIIILMLVGLLIGSWIASGTVPALIYYGLKLLSPRYFLAATLLICSIVAVSTGTSWTTAGTVGIALMGVGGALGIPSPMTAGAIISGSYFGDKMSPLSDTTNLAPAVAGGELFDHIRAMVWTTAPTYIIALIIYIVIGLRFSGDTGNLEDIAIISNTMIQTYKINIITLIPPIFIIVSAWKKWPAIPSLMIGIFLACLTAFFMQGQGISDLISIVHYGYESETGVKAVDDLLTRGGLDSMMWTISLIVCALSFGGIMESCGFLESILSHLSKYLKSVHSLVGITLISSYLSNFFLGDQFLGIIVPGRTFKPAYEAMGLAPRMLSRTLEDCGTISSPLIPWTACGAFMSNVLGVGSFTFMPYAFFNWLNPIVAFLMTFAGIGIFWRKADGTITQDKTQSVAARQEA